MFAYTTALLCIFPNPAFHPFIHSFIFNFEHYEKKVSADFFEHNEFGSMAFFNHHSFFSLVSRSNSLAQKCEACIERVGVKLSVVVETRKEITINRLLTLCSRDCCYDAERFVESSKVFRSL